MMMMMVTLFKHFLGKTLWVHCNDWHLCNLWCFYTRLANCIIHTQLCPFVCQSFAWIPLICSVVKWYHQMTYDCQSCTRVGVCVCVYVYGFVCAHVCVFVIDRSLVTGDMRRTAKKQKRRPLCLSVLHATRCDGARILTDNMQKLSQTDRRSSYLTFGVWYGLVCVCV